MTRGKNSCQMSRNNEEVVAASVARYNSWNNYFMRIKLTEKAGVDIWYNAASMKLYRKNKKNRAATTYRTVENAR